MSRQIKIECEMAHISNSNNYKTNVNLKNPELSFIRELTEDEIVSNCNSDVDLFRRLLENDDVQEDLHEYLREKGYTYNKH